MVKGSDFAIEQIFFIVISEHLRQCGIHFRDPVIHGGQIDTFTQGLKQFREARFAFAFLGHIARKAADPMDQIIPHDRMQDAIKIAYFPCLFHARANHAGPAPPLHEAREPLLQGQTVTGFGKVEEFVQRAANDIGKGNVQKISETPVDGKNFAVVGNGK